MAIKVKLIKYADQVGIISSIICIIHCIALPILISIIATYSHQLASYEPILDIIFVVLAGLAVIFTIPRCLIFSLKILFIFSLLGFSIGIIFSKSIPYSYYLTLISSVGLIGSHSFNIYYKRKKHTQQNEILVSSKNKEMYVTETSVN